MELNWFVGMYRSAVDRGRAQAILDRIGEGGERGLEGDFEELREDAHAYSGGQPCSEVLPPP